MKKLLLATLLAVSAGLASAQSSVTIYGIMDVGYVGKNTKDSPSTATGTSNSSQFGQSAETASRLGFKGTEDLGGGMSAFFTIETGLTPESSSMSGLNNRQSFVGLKKNGIGETAVGTQFTPVWNAAAATDAGQLNNVAGDVIYPYAGSNAAQASSDSAMTVRLNNALTFKTVPVYGFTASGVYSLNNKNTTQTSSTTGGATNAGAWGLSADYTWQKLYAVLAYQSIKNVTDGSAASVSTVGTGTVGSTGITYVPAYTATNGTDNQLYGAATYDFGFLKAYAQVIQRKITSTLNNNQYLSRNAQQIGVRGNITSTIDAWASVGNGKVHAFGSSEPTANFTGYQVGSNYWLSKRTNLYAIFGSSQTSSVSTSGAVSGNMYATGIRHTF